MLIAIVDCGMGNLYSVKQALVHVAADKSQIVISDDAAVIDAADKVVFPGQGAAKDCMAAITSKGLDAVLSRAAAEKPFLGICLGLQVLFDYSEENDGTDCLGLLRGQVRSIGSEMPRGKGYKIPHMGWNRVCQTAPHPLWQRIDDNAYFYFVHSYYTAPDNPQQVVGRADYGMSFGCAVASDAIFAVQFHPEKSAECGLQLLRNFASWNGTP